VTATTTTHQTICNILEFKSYKDVNLSLSISFSLKPEELKVARSLQTQIHLKMAMNLLPMFKA